MLLDFMCLQEVLQKTKGISLGVPNLLCIAFDNLVDTMNSAPELDFHLPQTHQEWLEINVEWKQKSTHEIIAGRVTVMDGFFQACNKPTMVPYKPDL